MKNSDKEKLDAVIKNEAALGRALGIVSSPSNTVEIAIDITEENKETRALGQMVYTLLREDGQDIIAIGQIVSVQTKNRWHEDPAFKGVIKHHDEIPNLSGVADNRLAGVSVQSSFVVGDSPKPHTLGISPRTGGRMRKMTSNMMSALVRHHREAITYIGNIYGNPEVNLPMWFKHFGKTIEGKDGKEFGAGDAYHIGVFGKTGSGKTVASSLMLLGYAKNKTSMNILVLDPQGQFAGDRELLPDGRKIKDEVEAAGMRYVKLNLLEKIYLPDDVELLGDLLLERNFIRMAFNITTRDKQIMMRDVIVRYLNGRKNNPNFSLGNQNAEKLFEEMLVSLGQEKKLLSVYVPGARLEQLKEAIEEAKHKRDAVKEWKRVFSLFSAEEGKKSMSNMVKKLISENSSEEKLFVVLDLSAQGGEPDNENLHALFLKIVEKEIAEEGGALYAKGKRANCLIVMDEAHRFVARNSPDRRVRELTAEIVDAVRTTRKYGIGHMFITQSLESMDEEVIKQMRIFAFGFGLTVGGELRKIREIVNSNETMDLYRSFADPSSNQIFPFMFFGPVSPLSATGSPLFIEMYTDFAKFKEKNNPSTKENKK